MKRMVALMLLCLGLVPLLCGCLSREERARLEEFEQTAAEYYEKKYGTEVSIENYNYYYENSVFSVRTDHMYAECSDGTVVFYDADEDCIVDNKQSEQIDNALAGALRADLDELEEEFDCGAFIIEWCRSAQFSGDFYDSFYHYYYDGDIEDFIAKEDLELRMDLFLLCENEGAWLEAEIALEALLHNRYGTESSCDLVVGDELCYSDYDYQQIGYDGCYAKFYIGSERTVSYIQNYIKVADGIYVTAYEANFVLEEGDITLVETDLTGADIDRALLENYSALEEDDKERLDCYTVWPATPIYQLRFSDRVKEQFPDGLNVFLHYSPGEMDVDSMDVVYVFEPDRTGLCGCTQISDPFDYGEHVSDINEEDYYFVGKQFVCGDTQAQ